MQSLIFKNVDNILYQDNVYLYKYVEVSPWEEYYLIRLYDRDLFHQKEEDYEFIEILFNSLTWTGALKYVNKLLHSYSIENDFIRTAEKAIELAKDGYINIHSVNEIINGEEINRSYHIKEKEFQNCMEDENKQYELNVITEETGEFICKVHVDEDTTNALIERGFRAVLEDQIAEKDPMYKIKRVIFNDPATVILWENGDKTVVKAMPDDVYQPEVGFAMAYMKYVFGSRSQLMKYVKQWLPVVEELSPFTIGDIKITCDIDDLKYINTWDGSPQAFRIEGKLVTDEIYEEKDMPTTIEFDTPNYENSNHNEEIDEIIYNPYNMEAEK